MDSERKFDRRILIPLDRSLLAEQAIPYALALVQPDAELILLRVVPEPERTFGLLGAVSFSPAEVLRAPAGDFSDWTAIRAWARSIGDALRRETPSSAATARPGETREETTS